jgi:hypothetical protein
VQNHEITMVGVKMPGSLCIGGKGHKAVIDEVMPLDRGIILPIDR